MAGVRRCSKETSGSWLFTGTSILGGLFALSIVIVNRAHLFSQFTVCNERANCYNVASACYFSTTPTTDFQPCRYTYSVGAVVIFGQFTASLILLCAPTLSVTMYALSGGLSFAWWLAASIYWSKQANRIKNAEEEIGRGQWRQFCIGIGWTAVIVSVAQFLSAYVHYHVYYKHQRRQQQELEAQGIAFTTITTTTTATTPPTYTYGGYGGAALPAPAPGAYPHPYPYPYPPYGQPAPQQATADAVVFGTPVYPSTAYPPPQAAQPQQPQAAAVARGTDGASSYPPMPPAASEAYVPLPAGGPGQQHQHQPPPNAAAALAVYVPPPAPAPAAMDPAAAFAESSHQPALQSRRQQQQGQGQGLAAQPLLDGTSSSSSSALPGKK